MQKTSDRLLAAAGAAPGEHVTLGELVERLGERGFGFLLLLLTLPNTFPGPPGIALPFGIALALVALQVMLGYKEPRLPSMMSSRRMRSAHLSGFLGKAKPWLERVERRLKPRHSHMLGGIALRLIGGFAFVLAVVLALPIPLGNLPAAWALLVLSLGLLERDGLAIAIGVVMGVAALAWNLALLIAGERLLAALLPHLPFV